MNSKTNNKSTWAGALLGIGVMAAVDEILFHQVLAWHHFYDRSTPEIGLMSDGLLHAAELIAIVAGFFLVLDLRRRKIFHQPSAWAGFFIGMGGFKLFDGIVNHKLLRLHQIRYVDNLLPYDLAWNIGAAIFLVLGLYLLRRANRIPFNPSA
jgi:uncharacterized membrane protein